MTWSSWKSIKFGKNAKQGLLRRSRSFKVIEVGTNRMHVVVINSNWHPISYRFGVIAAYRSNSGHFAFLSPPLGGLGTTYDVLLGLIGKHVVDFLLLLIEFFARCYGSVATREKRSKIAIVGDFSLTLSVWSKISGRRGCPHQSFLHG